MITLRYEVRFLNEKGLIRTMQFLGEEKTNNFINEVENNPNMKLILKSIITV